MANNQNILNRSSLKKLFDGVSIPTNGDFAKLIDSLLVKQDDHFFGKWVPGISYKTDDIVIFNSVLYVFLSKDHAPDCDCDDDCCNDKTPEDCCRWQELQMCTTNVSDGDCDWIKYDENTMYAKVYGKVGIGTGNAPKAFFHLFDAKHHAQMMFNPAEPNIDLPMFKMTRDVPASSTTSHSSAYDDDDNAEEESESPLEPCPPKEGNQMFVSQQLEATMQSANAGASYRATCRTNTLGYLFKRKIENDGDEPSIAGQDEQTLMFITSTAERPRIGIGTTNPGAALDIMEYGKGRIILEPGEYEDPQIILVNLHPSDAKNYFILRVGEHYASLSTDAPCGFTFRRGEDFPNKPGHKHKARNLAVIDGEGDLRAHGLYVEPIKEGGRNIHDALRTLCELKPERHREGGDRQFGFSAENIREVLPHACKSFHDETEGIAYDDLVVLLVKSVQELLEDVNQLKKRLRDYE